MVNTATVTGKTGPGDTVTGLVLQNVQQINFRFDKSMIDIVYALSGTSFQKTFELSYTSIATVSFTLSAGNTAVTIST